MGLVISKILFKQGLCHETLHGNWAMLGAENK